MPKPPSLSLRFDVRKYSPVAPAARQRVGGSPVVPVPPMFPLQFFVSISYCLHCHVLSQKFPHCSQLHGPRGNTECATDGNSRVASVQVHPPPCAPPTTACCMILCESGAQVVRSAAPHRSHAHVHQPFASRCFQSVANSKLNPNAAPWMPSSMCTTAAQTSSPPAPAAPGTGICAIEGESKAFWMVTFGGWRVTDGVLEDYRRACLGDVARVVMAGRGVRWLYSCVWQGCVTPAPQQHQNQGLLQRDNHVPICFPPAA